PAGVVRSRNAFQLARETAYDACFEDLAKTQGPTFGRTAASLGSTSWTRRPAGTCQQGACRASGGGSSANPRYRTGLVIDSARSCSKKPHAIAAQCTSRAVFRQPEPIGRVVWMRVRQRRKPDRPKNAIGADTLSRRYQDLERPPYTKV